MRKWLTWHRLSLLLALLACCMLLTCLIYFALHLEGPPQWHSSPPPRVYVLPIVR